MKKKKKLGRRAAPRADDDARDEHEALQAIYGDSFKLAADESSFNIFVRAAPPGEPLDSDTSAARSGDASPAVLLVRHATACTATASLRCFACVCSVAQWRVTDGYAHACRALATRVP
jgi:hypothetical protein